ncbi:MAG TPA: AAA family ATPase, partial [Actinomycetota bacterium]
AEALLGDAKRVVELDFGQFDRAEDVNTLLGAPPAYIGFGEHLPLHDLARMPWSVVVCKNVDGCHPQVREVLAQALSDGFLTERSGKRVYLSDAMVVLTAPSEGAGRLSPGFLSEERTSSMERVLGARLVEQVDVVSTTRPVQQTEGVGWLEGTLLEGLLEQYREDGLDVEWGDSFLAWVRDQQPSLPSRLLLTRLVERRLGEALIPHLPAPGARAAVLVEAEDRELKVTERAGRRRGDR